MRIQRPVIDGFEVFGGLPEIGDVGIEYDIAQEIRDFAFGSLLEAVNKINLGIDDNSCKTKFGMFMQSVDARFEHPAHHSYLSARMEQSDSVNWWKLTIARVIASPENCGIRRITHKLESLDGELFTAKKQFKYLDRRESLVAIQNDTVEIVDERRKMYERAMTTEDANKLMTTLAQARNRISATRSIK